MSHSEIWLLNESLVSVINILIHKYSICEEDSVEIELRVGPVERKKRVKNEKKKKAQDGNNSWKEPTVVVAQCSVRFGSVRFHTLPLL